MSIGALIEAIIVIRDGLGLSREDRDVLAEACNRLSDYHEALAPFATYAKQMGNRVRPEKKLLELNHTSVVVADFWRALEARSKTQGAG